MMAHGANCKVLANSLIASINESEFFYGSYILFHL